MQAKKMLFFCRFSCAARPPGAFKCDGEELLQMHGFAELITQLG